MRTGLNDTRPPAAAGARKRARRRTGEHSVVSSAARTEACAAGSHARQNAARSARRPSSSADTAFFSSSPARRRVSAGLASLAMWAASCTRKVAAPAAFRPASCSSAAFRSTGLELCACCKHRVSWSMVAAETRRGALNGGQWAQRRNVTHALPASACFTRNRLIALLASVFVVFLILINFSRRNFNFQKCGTTASCN